MMKHQIIAFVVVGFTLLGGFGAFTGGFGTLAHENGPCDTATIDSPFMGMATPNVPYDLHFIDEMVMHHRGAIMSATMMIGGSKRPELRDLARRIQDDQQRQIDQMLAWRAEWYPEAAATPTMNPDAATPAMNPNGTTPAMAMEQEDGSMGGMMAGSGMMNGEITDRMFLRMMIPHHQLAIDMAQDALINAEHGEVKMLAQDIIDGQSVQITEMEGYLRDWYGEVSTRDAADEMLAMTQPMMGEC